MTPKKNNWAKRNYQWIILTVSILAIGGASGRSLLSGIWEISATTITQPKTNIELKRSDTMQVKRIERLEKKNNTNTYIRMQNDTILTILKSIKK